MQILYYNINGENGAEKYFFLFSRSVGEILPCFSFFCTYPTFGKRLFLYFFLISFPPASRQQQKYLSFSPPPPLRYIRYRNQLKTEPISQKKKGGHAFAYKENPYLVRCERDAVHFTMPRDFKSFKKNLFLHIYAKERGVCVFSFF